MFSRPAVIGLAVIGAACAGMASLLQARKGASASGVRRWNIVAYACMAASMALFIVAGFRGADP